MLGTAASFIPGVGVVGGLVSTAADLAHDLHDNKSAGEVWKNLGVNSAFTVLSAVGLGSLKGLVKAGKVADEAIDAGKLLNKATKLGVGAEEMTRLGSLGVTSVEHAGQIAETIQKGGKESKALIKALTGVKTISKLKKAELTEKAIQTLNKDVEMAGQLSNAVSPILGSTLLPTVGKSIVEGGSKLITNP